MTAALRNPHDLLADARALFAARRQVVSKAWRREWTRHRAEYGLAAVVGVALMSSYVHVLHRAVEDGPARQEAAYAAGATHDSEADRRDTVARLPSDEDVTKNRLFESFEMPRSSVAAVSM